MPNTGDIFRNYVKEYIDSWGAPLETLTEVNVGWRFNGTPRKLDIVIRNKENNKYLGIECKVQLTSGTAYEKLPYALEDCVNSPIPTILVFGGPYIRDDMRSKLIMSGKGIGVDFSMFEIDNEQKYELNDPKSLLRQRCYIELGLDWFPFATGDRINEQLSVM